MGLDYRGGQSSRSKGKAGWGVLSEDEF